ncbi:ketopantoate reductase family protein [Rhodococcus globerulus]|uniref:2-dehydropantoate 2-reductase N-terminal domain-containing protein n=1 Tax=Rhodococcus globerulus TaxID=33008 RepID=A0ABU4C583_RHOGO|nr:2-dehydropantoate 2-reductase N-terminal domain-containing protein [Rhodococcus globerulus]MDV6271434.1 2-dehydropantoate 2-reductase N-terminal domain-containing protein [Rhodococcus globerulus]
MSTAATSSVDRRIIVIGPGATGGAIAAELNVHGADVVVVARGAELEAIRERGLIYHTPDGTRTVNLNTIGGPEEINLTDRDVLVLTTKSQDAEQALRTWAWRPVTTSNGDTRLAGEVIPLVTVQNGLNTDRAALRWFKTVIAGTIYCPGGKERVGEIANYGADKRLLLWVGNYPTGEIDDRLREIVAAFRVAPTLGVQAIDSIVGVKAWKLSYNTVNGLEPVFAPSTLRDELKDGLFREALDVFAALGIDLIDPIGSGISEWTREAIEGSIDGHVRPGNSTLQSFLRRSPLETDYLNGEIVLLGRQHGVPTPLNEALQLLSAEAFESDLPAGYLGDDVIERLLADRSAPTTF